MSSDALRDSHPFRSAEARDRYLSRYDAQAASWPIASETRMVRTEHGETLVRICGPSQGAPLVLLPGVWAHSLTWSPLLISVLSESYRTYLVDNIVDFGRSVSSRSIKRTAGLMGWLDRLFDALELAKDVNLMGLSRGGWLAAEYTLHAPQRLAKVIWLSPGGVILIGSREGMKGMPLSIAAAMAPSPRTVRALLQWLMPDYAQSNEAAFGQYVDDCVLGLTCFDTSEVGRIWGPRKFGDSELAGIEVPVLYLAGEKERMYSVPAAASRLKSVAPQIETAVVQDTGHGLVAAQPEAVGRRMLEFLDG